MKKRTIQKIGALFLVLCMIFSLTACADKGGKSAEAESGKPSSETADAANSEGTGVKKPETGETANTSDIDVFGLDPNNPVKFNTYVNFTWYPISEWKGIIAEEITRLTGVSMDFTVAVDDQQLGVMIASGDLPDLVFTQSFLTNLSSGDLSYDWQSLIDEYDTGWEIDQQRIANSLSFSQEKDKFFTVLSHFATDEDWKELKEIGVGAPMAASLLYRHDLYEEMGSPEITDMESIRALLLKAKETYPEMRPLVCDVLSWRYSYFRQCFGLSNGAKYQEQ